MANIVCHTNVTRFRIWCAQPGVSLSPQKVDIIIQWVKRSYNLKWNVIMQKNLVSLSKYLCHLGWLEPLATDVGVFQEDFLSIYSGNMVEKSFCHVGWTFWLSVILPKVTVWLTRTCKSKIARGDDLWNGDSNSILAGMFVVEGEEDEC